MIDAIKRTQRLSFTMTRFVGLKCTTCGRELPITIRPETFTCTCGAHEATEMHEDAKVRVRIIAPQWAVQEFTAQLTQPFTEDQE